VNQRGAVGVGGLLAVFAATSVLLTVAILFATGIAQQTILPRLKARAAQTAPAPATVATAGEPVSAPDGGGAEVDSLRALRMQVQLEQEQLAARAGELQTTIAQWKTEQQGRDAEATKRITAMAKIYSTMKPEAAARVLVRLDDATFEQVVAKLDKRQAGKILALIDPDRLARLTQSGAPKSTPVPVEAGM
jgi:flagellar motility protein MotE (MotC chaperone)